MKLLIATAALAGWWSVGLAHAAPPFYWDLHGKRLLVAVEGNVIDPACILRTNDSEPRNQTDGTNVGVTHMVPGTDPGQFRSYHEGSSGRFTWPDCRAAGVRYIKGVVRPLYAGQVYPAVVDVGDLGPGETKTVRIRPITNGNVNGRVSVDWSEDSKISSSQWKADYVTIEGQITAVGAGPLDLVLHVRFEAI